MTTCAVRVLETTQHATRFAAAGPVPTRADAGRLCFALVTQGARGETHAQAEARIEAAARERGLRFLKG